MKSLQEECLDVIVFEFERYHTAYSNCKEENAMRNFEFLQRKYTLDIISDLEDRNHLKPKYFDFLLNKYLKEFDTEWFTKCSWNSISQKLSAIGPNIETLHVSDTEKSCSRIFGYLKNLKSVKFEACCTNTYLKYVAKHCRAVEKIDMRGSPDVDNTGITYLCKIKNGKPACPELKVIYLENTRISHEGIKMLLENIHTIEEIDFLGLPHVLYSLHKENFKTLDKVDLYNITQLDLLPLAPHPHFNEMIEICTSVCPHLRSLSCPVFTQEHLDLCIPLPNLEILHLENNGNSLLNINNFLNLKGDKLASLTLNNFEISLSILFKNSRCLKKLVLNKVTLEPLDKSPFVCHNLQTFNVEFLDFSDSKTSDSLCKVLQSSPNLEELRLLNCNALTTEFKSEILKCCKEQDIKELYFNYSKVEKEFIREVILTCSTLQILSIDGCGFEESFVDDLNDIAISLPNEPEIIYTDYSIGSNYDLYDEYDDEFDDSYDDEDDEDSFDYDNFYLPDYDDLTHYFDEY